MATDKEAMQIALDALDRLVTYDNHGEPYDGKDVEGAEAIEALRAALAQPEPEPMAWLSIGAAKMIHWTPDKPAYGGEWEPLYTAPPQRKEWVGLTDEETEQIADKHWNDPPMFAEAIEAKIKEKNT